MTHRSAVPRFLCKRYRATAPVFVSCADARFAHADTTQVAAIETKGALMTRYRSLVLSLLLFCAAVRAETSLRVGTKVLTLGDSAVRMQQLLGRPTVRALSHAHVGGCRTISWCR
jgi:hypothetical protein